MILIQSALKHYLLDHDNQAGLTKDPIRLDARKRLATLIGSAIGINHEPDKPHRFRHGRHRGETDAWMIIRKTGTTRHQGLTSEACLATQTLDITAYATGGPSSLVVELAAEAARQAVSTWQGNWRFYDEDQVRQSIWIADAIADSDDMTAFRFSEGKRWTDWAGFTLRVTHQQVTPGPLPVLTEQGPAPIPPPITSTPTVGWTPEGITWLLQSF